MAADFTLQRIDPSFESALQSLYGAPRAINSEPTRKADWRVVVREFGHGRQPPIPEDICDECDKMVEQFARCVVAEDRVFDLCRTSKYNPEGVFGLHGRFLHDIRVFADRFTIAAALGFTPPTGDVATLDELRQQVDRYVAALAAYKPPAPATSH